MKRFLVELLRGIFIIIVILAVSFGVVYISLRLSYKRQYYAVIEKYCLQYDVDVNTVYAIIKTESNFDKSAESSKGAKGLMQISDVTASDIAKDLNIESFDVFDVETNVKFGVYYISYLSNYYNGNTNNVLCAYNAGLGNVDKWLSNINYSKDGVNLIKIPYKETRNYIKKVNYNLKIYNLLYR